jgi:hypothetical protein
MKNRILLLILCMACEPYIDTERALQEGSDTGLTRSATYSSHTATELVFETEVSLLYQYGDVEDMSYLAEGSFTFDPNYTILDFTTTQIDARGKSSTILVMDQSGSYSEADPQNRRSKSADKFFYDVFAPSDFILGASAKGGLVSPEPLELYRPDFSTDAQGQVPYLFGLAKRTGGKNAIYDALSQAIDKAATSTGLKNVVALVHGPDEMSLITSDALIAKAVSAQVKISIVMLGKADAAAGLAKICASTGGLFSLCPSENEMITTFNHLYRLINGISTVYHMRVKYVPKSGSFVTGAETMHTLNVRYASQDYDFNPVLVYVKIP